MDAASTFANVEVMKWLHTSTLEIRKSINGDTPVRVVRDLTSGTTGSEAMNKLPVIMGGTISNETHARITIPRCSSVPLVVRVVGW